jgi:glycosyltransferase involved in cell wall biosynthesis
VLDRITPVLLTLNEEANIGRTLQGLIWARDIVVVDSLSTDATLSIVRRMPQARVFSRAFTTHAEQWTYAITETGIGTDWVLALDADYEATEEFVAEVAALDPGDEISGYRAAFRYCVLGRPLRGALYPPVTVLFRRARARYEQDGHTQRVICNGAIAQLRAPLLHDDRKPLSLWLASQDRYMRLEAEKLSSTPRSRREPADRVRMIPLLAPLLVFAYCYLLKGGVFDGRAGLYYALQRTLAENLLSLRLLERTLARGTTGDHV